MWDGETQSSDCVGERETSVPGVAKGVQWEELSPDSTVTGEGKAGPSQVARGWGFAEEPHRGESWPKPRRRPRLVTPPIPGAGTKPDSPGKSERAQPGTWSQSNKCPCSSRRRCRAAAGKQDPARPTLPCLSPDPSALTPPHDALQPPLRHRRRHLPQAVEPQPPPPTHNLLWR